MNAFSPDKNAGFAFTINFGPSFPKNTISYLANWTGAPLPLNPLDSKYVAQIFFMSVELDY